MEEEEVFWKKRKRKQGLVSNKPLITQALICFALVCFVIAYY